MPRSSTEVRTFDADLASHPSFSAGFRDALNTIWLYRFQVVDAFSAEIANRFARTALGSVWAIILPLVPLSAYLFLRLMLGAASDEEPMHPATYVVIGVTAWLLLADSILAPIRALPKASRPANGDSLPLLVTMLVAMVDVWFEFLLRVLLVGLVVAVFETVSLLGMVLALPLLVLCSAYAFGVGILLAILSLAYPDLENILQVVLRYGVFLSLAIFPFSPAVTEAWLWLNPFAVVIDSLRTFLLTAEFSFPVAFGWVNLVGLVVLLQAIYQVSTADLRLRSLL